MKLQKLKWKRRDNLDRVAEINNELDGINTEIEKHERQQVKEHRGESATFANNFHEAVDQVVGSCRNLQMLHGELVMGIGGATSTDAD